MTTTGTAKRFFFNDGDTLAMMFTQRNEWNPEKNGKYMEGGLKPIEAFEGDILTNLVEWASEGVTIYYRTKEYWYTFTLVDMQGAPIIEMTRFNNGSWVRLDTWENKHSCSVGKEFLAKPEQKAKYIPLFNVVK